MHNEEAQIVICPKMPPGGNIFPFESAVGQRSSSVGNHQFPRSHKGTDRSRANIPFDGSTTGKINLDDKRRRCRRAVRWESARLVQVRSDLVVGGEGFVLFVDTAKTDVLFVAQRFPEKQGELAGGSHSATLPSSPNYPKGFFHCSPPLLAQVSLSSCW